MVFGLFPLRVHRRGALGFGLPVRPSGGVRPLRVFGLETLFGCRTSGTFEDPLRSWCVFFLGLRSVAVAVGVGRVWERGALLAVGGVFLRLVRRLFCVFPSVLGFGVWVRRGASFPPVSRFLSSRVWALVLVELCFFAAVWLCASPCFLFFGVVAVGTATVARSPQPMPGPTPQPTSSTDARGHEQGRADRKGALALGRSSTTALCVTRTRQGEADATERAATTASA